MMQSVLPTVACHVSVISSEALPVSEILPAHPSALHFCPDRYLREWPAISSVSWHTGVVQGLHEQLNRERSCNVSIDLIWRQG